MIHPISSRSRRNATKPPMSGQYMVRTISSRAGASVAPALRSSRRRPRVRVGRRPSGVQGQLLVGARKRPGNLQPAFLAEHEAELAGRAQALGVVRAIARTRPRLGYRAQKIAVKKAVLARRLADCATPVRHAVPVSSRLVPRVRRSASKRTSMLLGNRDSRKSHELRGRGESLQTAEKAGSPTATARYFRGFRGRRSG